MVWHFVRHPVLWDIRKILNQEAQKVLTVTHLKFKPRLFAGLKRGIRFRVTLYQCDGLRKWWHASDCRRRSNLIRQFIWIWQIPKSNADQESNSHDWEECNGLFLKYATSASDYIDSSPLCKIIFFLISGFHRTLLRCATSRTVPGSIPGGVTGDFFFRGTPDRTMCPKVDLASESEYQGFLLG